MDYYAILGVHPTAEDIVIRAAFKALAQRYHPDRYTGPTDEAHRRMSDLTKAYEVLADPVRRQKYDRRRLTYTQSVATYFTGAPKTGTLEMDLRDLRATAAKRKRSRIALSALLGAVVVLSTFNLVQYSAQIKDWLAASPTAASSPAETATMRTKEVAVTGAVGTAPADAPASASAKSRNLPISQGSANAPPAATLATAPATAQVAAVAVAPPADPPAVPSATPAAAAPNVAPVAPAPAPMSAIASAPPPAVPAAPRPRPEPPPAESRAATGPLAVTPRPPSAEPPSAAAAAALLLPGRPGPQETRRSVPAAAGAMPPPAEHPATPAPTTRPASDPCREAVAALGLCTPHTTARNN